MSVRIASNAPQIIPAPPRVGRAIYKMPQLAQRIDIVEACNDRCPLPADPWEGARVFVAGHTGLVGRALCRRLATEPCDVLTAPRSELDLRSRQDTARWVRDNRPDYIILAAATVGGIGDNVGRPAEFIMDNLAIALSVVEAAWRHDVEKLVFLGSSCIYPRMATSPIMEEALLSGPLEPSNEPYAVAKIAGLKLVQAVRRQYGCDFISVMPTNLYGPGDRFDETRGHVIPALIARFERARQENAPECVVWGTGLPLREFLHVDDCADAIIHVTQHYSSDEPINIGSGEEISIATLARLIARFVGYKGRIVFNASQPDGTPRKLVDSTRLRALGWRPRISLRDGLEQTISWWRRNGDSQKAACTGE